MRLKLFGFPDESPHAIPGPDDFCITKMMWLGLMEPTVSRGISHRSPKMVYRSRVCPLTQCSTKVLSQQSCKNRKRAGRMEMAIKCSQKKSEWVYLLAKEKTKGWSLQRGSVFFCLLHKSQEILLRLFFSCWVHSDSPLLSLHLTELMSRFSQTWGIFTSRTAVILQGVWLCR